MPNALLIAATDRKRRRAVRLRMEERAAADASSCYRRYQRAQLPSPSREQSPRDTLKSLSADESPHDLLKLQAPRRC
jgi:hypothetical protein